MFDYSLDFHNIDFRKNPELYRVGKWEQWVLLVEPYKSEILPHWRFRTPDIARESSERIYAMFLDYLSAWDFVGADMARKFLQMGYTRSRRYANHRSGRKYSREDLDTPKPISEVPNYRSEKNRQHYVDTKTKKILPQEEDALTNEKAESARIFYAKYLLARENEEYKRMKREWEGRYGR